MGLDISFNYDKAKKAGLKFKTVSNNENLLDGQDIADLFAKGDYGYAKWLLTSTLCIQVPNTHLAVEVGISKHSGESVCQLRANKWGAIYEPLTLFLSKNGIEWDEH